MTPAAVVQAAQEWLRVPYHHQGRVRAGVDCVGLIVVVGKSLGLFAQDFDYGHYGRSATGELDAILDKHLVRIPEPVPGCIVSIRWWKRAHHLAIYTGRDLIHSHQSFGGVTQHRCDGRWLRRIVAAYDFPGVTRGQ